VIALVWSDGRGGKRADAETGPVATQVAQQAHGATPAQRDAGGLPVVTSSGPVRIGGSGQAQ
jgi:hypothetical protein